MFKNSKYCILLTVIACSFFNVSAQTNVQVLRSEYEKVGDEIYNINDVLEGSENYVLNAGNENSYYSLDQNSGIISIQNPIADVFDVVTTNVLQISISSSNYIIEIVDGYDYFIQNLDPSYEILDDHNQFYVDPSSKWTAMNNLWGKGTAVPNVDFRTATIYKKDIPDSTIFLWDVPSKAAEFGGASVWNYVNVFWGNRNNVRDDLKGFPFLINDINTLSLDFDFEQLFGSEEYKIAMNMFLTDENYLTNFSENDGDFFFVFDQNGTWIPPYPNSLPDTEILGKPFAWRYKTENNYEWRRVIVKDNEQLLSGTLDIKELFDRFQNEDWINPNQYIYHIQLGLEITEGYGAVRFNKAEIDLSVSNEEIISRIGRGINLGNTLSAPIEGNWEPPVREAYFKDVAEAGFSTVRIPMDFFGERTTGDTSVYSKIENSQSEYTGTLSDYVVDATYMNRIQDVIDMSLSNELITVLDFHGNTLKDEFLHTHSPKDKWSEFYTHPTSAKRAADNEKFRAIWTTIAERFKNYSNELIFEIVNEPYFFLTATEMDALNADIIEIIRNSGGNNATRLIVITGGSENSINAPLQIGDAILESDDNLIATFHYYWPRAFTASSGENDNDFNWGTQEDRDEIDTNFEIVKNWASENNIPILLGEFAADNEGGFKYSTGDYGKFGGPDNDSRVAFHGFIADLAIEKGFGFTAWDAGHKSNKTIHKRTDDPSTVSYYPNGGVDTSNWVEDVKNALLGIPLYPNEDDDNDGVINANDECPNTTIGDEVNEQGCTIVALSVDDISIIGQSETCASKNNGSIEISVKNDLSFKVEIKSENFNIEDTFIGDFSLNNLKAGTYSICLSTQEIKGFEQCYELEIREPEELSVSSKISKKEAKLNLKLEGGKSYIITVNGERYITNKSEVSLPLKKGKNKLNVTTDIICQGEFNEELILDSFEIYPTIFSETLNVKGENLTSLNVLIFDTLGRKMNVKYNSKTNSEIQLNTSHLSKGIYFIKINDFTKIILKK